MFPFRPGGEEWRGGWLSEGRTSAQTACGCRRPVPTRSPTEASRTSKGFDPTTRGTVRTVPSLTHPLTHPLTPPGPSGPEPPPPAPPRDEGAIGRGRRPAADVTSTHSASEPRSGGFTCNRADTHCCSRARASAGRGAAIVRPVGGGRAWAGRCRRGNAYSATGGLPCGAGNANPGCPGVTGCRGGGAGVGAGALAPPSCGGTRGAASRAWRQRRVTLVGSAGGGGGGNGFAPPIFKSGFFDTQTVKGVVAKNAGEKQQTPHTFRRR